MKPNINSVEVHPQLSNNRHPVDGVLVGTGSLLPYDGQGKGKAISWLARLNTLCTPCVSCCLFSSHKWICAIHTHIYIHTHSHTHIDQLPRYPIYHCWNVNCTPIKSLFSHQVTYGRVLSTRNKHDQKSIHKLFLRPPADWQGLGNQQEAASSCWLPNITIPYEDRDALSPSMHRAVVKCSCRQQRVP